MMHRPSRQFRRAFSLPEMCISMAASTIILGGLLLSGMTLQKSLHGSEVYAGAYSDQRRVIDYIGRDLRRAIGISATDASGDPYALRGQSVEVLDRATLSIFVPGYYQSDAPTAAGYDNPLPVIVAESGPTYGVTPTSTSSAAPLKIVYRKIFLSSAQAVCFSRQEGSAREEIIVRNAQDLHASLDVDERGRSAVVKAWFLSPYSGQKPVVSSYDEVMLRNVRLDQPQ
jgi:Tfp pilus assembly protein PilW